MIEVKSVPYTREILFPPLLEIIPQMKKSAIEGTTIQNEIVSSVMNCKQMVKMEL